MISQGEGFILQSRKYSRNNAGKSLSKYLLLKRNEFAYNHGASKAKPFGVSYRLIESDEARVPYVYHAFSMQTGDLNYWSYALNTEGIERQLQQIITSGVRMDGLLNISFEAYMSLSVPFPSLPEQKNIATLLSTVDSTVALCQRKVDLLTQAKKALMQQIFSQKLRFKADDGSDFPEWEEKKLGDIATKIDRKAPKDSTADVRMISQGEGFILQSRKYSRNNAGKSLSKYLLLKRNEFAYNHGASKAKPFGVSYRLIESKEARVPYVYHAFSMQLGDLDYWCYALNTESIERQLQQIITSGVRMDGLLNISFDAYMSLSVPYPSLPEQQKIASCLSSTDALIDQTRIELEQWQEVKKSLLQQMFV